MGWILLPRSLPQANPGDSTLSVNSMARKRVSPSSQRLKLTVSGLLCTKNRTEQEDQSVNLRIGAATHRESCARSFRLRRLGTMVLAGSSGVAILGTLFSISCPQIVLT